MVDNVLSDAVKYTPARGRVVLSATVVAGIGRSIRRHIARLLGGETTVASRVGQGTTFTRRLPAHRQESYDAA